MEEQSEREAKDRSRHLQAAGLIKAGDFGPLVFLFLINALMVESGRSCCVMDLDLILLTQVPVSSHVGGGREGGRSILGPDGTMENGNIPSALRKRSVAIEEPGVPIGLEKSSVLSPRGTGWWLRASRAAGALAKEAQVHGRVPAGTGA